MTMRMILILLMALLPVVASARDLTLEQALQIARDHNQLLNKSVAETQSASEALAAAKAGRFPTLSATAYANFVDNIPTMDLTIPGLGTMHRDLGSKETYQSDVRLTLPVYTGGRLSSAIRQAESGRDYRQALQQAELDNVYYKARLDYFTLCRSLKLKEAAEASLKRTEIIRHDVESSFEAGVADSVDMLEADLSHTQASFAAEQAAMNVRSSTIKLISLLGLDPAASVTVTDTLPDPQPPTMPKIPEITRGELLAADASISLNKARISAQKAGYLPSLSLVGGYSYGKPNGNFFANDWRDYWTAGVNLNWSFNLGFETKSKTRAAQYDLEASRRQRDDLSESFNREAGLAAEQLDLAYTRYESARREYQITSRNYELARAQHHNGVLSSNRLQEVQTALTQAESSLAAAKVDFYLAQSAYWFACGSDNLGKGI